jgi:hypothetical protein
MKRVDGTMSDVSDVQRGNIALLEECGYKCAVAFGAKHAWREIATYLGLVATLA